MAAKLPKPKECFFLDRQRSVFELNINAMFFFFFLKDQWHVFKYWFKKFLFYLWDKKII